LSHPLHVPIAARALGFRLSFFRNVKPVLILVSLLVVLLPAEARFANCVRISRDAFSQLTILSDEIVAGQRHPATSQNALGSIRDSVSWPADRDDLAADGDGQSGHVLIDSRRMQSPLRIRLRLRRRNVLPRQAGFDHAERKLVVSSIDDSARLDYHDVLGHV